MNQEQNKPKTSFSAWCDAFFLRGVMQRKRYAQTLEFLHIRKKFGIYFFNLTAILVAKLLENKKLKKKLKCFSLF